VRALFRQAFGRFLLLRDRQKGVLSREVEFAGEGYDSERTEVEAGFFQTF
jgi:hypothetical protein